MNAFFFWCTHLLRHHMHTITTFYIEDYSWRLLLCLVYRHHICISFFGSLPWSYLGFIWPTILVFSFLFESAIKYCRLFLPNAAEIFWSSAQKELYSWLTVLCTSTYFMHDWTSMNETTSTPFVSEVFDGNFCRIKTVELLFHCIWMSRNSGRLICFAKIDFECGKFRKFKRS